jgi:hypothetical protein
LDVVCSWRWFEEGSGWSTGDAARVLIPKEEAGSGAGGSSACFTVNEATPSGVSVLGFGARLHRKL